jgi:hypothetical protein
MPAAQTEIFGSSDHEVLINDITTSTTTATLSVDCSVPSTSATAILIAQYSLDGSVFTNLGSPDALNIGAASPCGFGGSLNYLITQIFGVPTFPPLGQTIWLRVVGQNGNGVGDNPVFGQVLIQLIAPFSVSIPVVLASAFLTPNGFSILTNVLSSSPVSTAYTVQWQAEG